MVVQKPKKDNVKIQKQDFSNILGAKFYKSENGEVTQKLRVISFVNESTARVWDGEKGFKMSFKELLTEYVMLQPHGMVLFSIVGLPNNIKDVIVSMFKYPNDDGIPYCVCRQNMIDVHAALVNPNSLEVGCCVSVETVPDGMDYAAVRACDTLDMYTTVAIYLDDTLDDILKCVHKISKYDDVLQTLYQMNRDRLKLDVLKEEADKANIYGGWCRTTRDLLINNSFMYDFRRSFGIAEIKDVTIPDCFENSVQLNSVIEEFLSKEYGFYINNSCAFAFDYDIDLDQIDRDFSIIADKSDRLFVITYDKGNSYVVDSGVTPAEKLENIIEGTTN